MAKTIRTNQLAPNSIYLVRGKVTYSRISKHCTDEERAKMNEKRTFKIGTNFTSITICEAQVLAKNPQAPTIEERYAAECLYHSSANNSLNFNAMNKSRQLPSVAVASPTQPGVYDPITLEPGQELAAGLDVTLVMRVFKNEGSNNGVSLDTVLVNEPIRFYTNNNGVKAGLKEFGITFTAEAPSQGPVAEAAQPQSTPVAAPFAAATNASQATPASTPAASGNPFASYDANNVPTGIQFGPGNNREY